LIGCKFKKIGIQNHCEKGEHVTFADLPSSPNPFSQNGEKGSQIQSPSPALGEGFRVRATKVTCSREKVARKGKFCVPCKYAKFTSQIKF
jgi:hypothetical protein